jgi:hypothetical protein
MSQQPNQMQQWQLNEMARQQQAQAQAQAEQSGKAQAHQQAEQSEKHRASMNRFGAPPNLGWNSFPR